VHPQQVCWWQHAVGFSRHTRGMGCHPEGPRQAQINLMRFNKSKYKILHMVVLVFFSCPGSWTWASNVPSQKANHILDCIKRSMAIRSREVILSLCTGETSPGVLCTDAESLVQEWHGLVWVCPEKGHRNVPWNGTPLLWGQAERAWALQPGGEKAVRWPDSSLSVSKGELQEQLRSQNIPVTQNSQE